MKLHLFADYDVFPDKINAIPGEAEQFTLTHSCKQGDNKQILQLSPLNGGKEIRDLLFIQRSKIFFLYSRW